MKTRYLNFVFALLFFFAVLDCRSESDSPDPSPLLLFLMGSSSKNVGDGCNFKTQFTVCVPPGIGGE